MRTEPRGEEINVSIEKGTTIETLKDYQSELPYNILAAKVNNKVQELNKTIDLSL